MLYLVGEHRETGKEELGVFASKQGRPRVEERKREQREPILGQISDESWHRPDHKLDGRQNALREA